MFKHTSKFELNLSRTDNPMHVCNAAIKYRAHAIVIDDPVYIPLMLSTRYSTKGNWKLILAVDFPDGNNYAFSNKFKHLDQSVFGCDGFDIMLSKRNEVESANEVKSILTQLKNINELYDIRFVIDAFSRDIESVKTTLNTIKNHPPKMIRLDHHLQLNNVNENKIAEVMKLVREYIAVPVKLSTNVNLEIMNKFMNTIDLFDVHYKKAAEIENKLKVQI